MLNISLKSIRFLKKNNNWINNFILRLVLLNMRGMLFLSLREFFSIGVFVYSLNVGVRYKRSYRKGSLLLFGLSGFTLVFLIIEGFLTSIILLLVLFVVLLIPFGALSFLFTLRFEFPIQFLVFFLGFVFTYFINSAIVDPIFYLIIQKRVCEELQMPEKKR